jgi:glyoxylase-like metal-dependent hydrolase (beta-lactamase superfamily II)
MKITQLKKNPRIYTCNAYLIRGDWNAIGDVNTLIDTGTDGYILEELQTISTGVGKRRVEQIIITHEHFDHAGGLKKICDVYQPKVIAFSQLEYVNTQAFDGQKVQIGDKDAVIFHTPGHSNDSICIYCEEEKALFSGDTPLNIKTPGGTYLRTYMETLEKFSLMPIEKIYSGHDDPITENAQDIIRFTLENVRKSKIID